MWNLLPRDIVTKRDIKFCMCRPYVCVCVYVLFCGFWCYCVVTCSYCLKVLNHFKILNLKHCLQCRLQQNNADVYIILHAYYISIIRIPTHLNKIHLPWNEKEQIKTDLWEHVYQVSSTKLSHPFRGITTSSARVC